MKIQMKLVVLIDCEIEEMDAARELDRKKKAVTRELELMLGQVPKVSAEWVYGPIETLEDIARYPVNGMGLDRDC